MSKKPISRLFCSNIAKSAVPAECILLKLQFLKIWILSRIR